jgi:3-phosphoshikimate 1-carboxyvinyltransferase
VTVTGLNPTSHQADRAILEALDAVGARIKIGEDFVSVEKADLRPFEFDATQCPDLFPPLTVLAASCQGKSVIYGLDRLTHKESNRAQALEREFGKLGISIRAAGRAMEIHGGAVRGSLLDSHHDHRIAMACAVAGLGAEASVGIADPACVSKSYPGFFSALETLMEAP